MPLLFIFICNSFYKLLCQSYALAKVVPFRIIFLNKNNFPITLPFLQLFFTIYGINKICIGFKINKFLYFIKIRETGIYTCLMFSHSAQKIIGNTNIQDTIAFACHYVNKPS